MTRIDRAEQLLDHAQRMIQERGFNAFSYSDLADAVGIRTASVHYHFPSKANLGHRVMQRYNRALHLSLTALDALPSPKDRLRGFIDAYRQTEARGAICLCGSMASDIETLSDDTRSEIERYLTDCERWVGACIEDGVGQGLFAAQGSVDDVARNTVAALQGALIVGRARGEAQLLDAVERQLFASLTPND